MIEAAGAQRDSRCDPIGEFRFLHSSSDTVELIKSFLSLISIIRKENHEFLDSFVVSSYPPGSQTFLAGSVSV